MTMRSWIRRLFTRPVTRTLRKAPRRFRPVLETLEDRLAPAFTLLVDATGATVGVMPTVSGTTTTFTATAAGAHLNVNDILTALNIGDVVVDSGSTGTQDGNITINAGFSGASERALTFQTGSGSGVVGNIAVNANFTLPGVALDFLALNNLIVNGTLNSGGGGCTLTATNGAISQTSGDVETTIQLSLTAGTGIGASGAPLALQVGTLTANSSGSNGNQFLSETGTAQLASPNALNAGSGSITLAGGAFQITSGAGGNAIADTSPLTITSPAVLDLAGHNETIDALNGSGAVTSSASGAATLQVNNGGAFSGALQDGGSGEVVALTVDGGTLTLRGANTYSGATTVAAGTLLVDGSTEAASAATVALGATLGGAGTVGGTVSDSGAIAPGDSGPGVLATSRVGFASNSTFAVQVGGATAGNASNHYAQLDVTGNVSIGSAVTLNLSAFDGFVPALGETFTIIHNTGNGALSGTFSDLPEGAAISNFLGSGRSAVITYAGGSNHNDVVLTVGATVFSGLHSESIVYGTATTTLSGHLAAGPAVPPAGETVSITINSTTETATLDGSGDFSIAFPMGTLGVVGSPYTVTYAYAGDGTFTSASDSSTTLTVTPAPLTAVVTANNKIYDGTTVATISSETLSGTIFGSDKVNVTGGTATFGTANVGNSNTVTVTGLSLSGASAGNYALSSTTATTAADIAPGSASHFIISAPATAVAGSLFSFTVTAQDPFGNTATGYTGTVHFTSTDGQAVLPADSTLSNGTGNFSATLKTAGSQTITATDTVTSTIASTSGSIDISPAAATHFTVSAPAAVNAGSAFSFTVTAQDPFGNTAAGYTGTVRFTSSDGLAVLPANSTLSNGTGAFSTTLRTAGPRTITATDVGNSSITGASSSITVVAPPAAITNVSPGGATLAVGGTASIIWTNTSFSGNVDVLLSTNGGASFSKTIASNVSNTGHYSWSVPLGDVGSMAEIRVQGHAGGTPQGVSSVFTITTASTFVSNVTAGSLSFSSKAQTLNLSASVTDNFNAIVNEGVVTFTITDGQGHVVGTAKGYVLEGVARTTFQIPAGLARGTYTVTASYSDVVAGTPVNPSFQTSSGGATFTIT